MIKIKLLNRKIEIENEVKENELTLQSLTQHKNEIK